MIETHQPYPLPTRQTLSKESLDQLYRVYNHKKYIQYDPIRYIYGYENQTEKELMALISSCLSFGRVTQIFKAVDRVLEISEGKPYDYVISLKGTPDSNLALFQYRFVSGRDLFMLLAAAKEILEEYGSLGNFAKTLYQPGKFLEFAGNFIRAFQGIYYLIPGSLKKSSCKRFFMFLRWMVRNDNIDSGLWNFIDPRELVIPLDTHVFRTARELGFTARNTPSLAAAIEITDHLRCFCEEDPVKYDWAISHAGIIRNNFMKECSS